MDLFEKCYKRSLADEYREEGIYPYFHALETRQDTEVIMEGKRRIMLGSNNYLGFTADEEIIDQAQKALAEYGTGCSGSRFLNGTLKLHLTLEEELAAFLNKEAAMTFSTGFQSNLGIISAITGRNDYIVSDKENHASIYDGAKLSYAKTVRYEHSDMDSLKKRLESVPDSAGCLIVTDGVFSMSGDIAKLPDIVELAEKYGARVMVDDAHGLGVIGDGGRGTASYFGLEDKIDILMGTFSKSLASLGGYMAASERVVDYVRHTSRPFIFSASIPPVCCASALASLRKLKANPEIPEKLKSLSLYYREGCDKRGIKVRKGGNDGTIPIIPIYTYTLENTLKKAIELYESGVYTNPVLPPAAPADGCLLRTSLMATHTKELLDEALDIIQKVLIG